MIDLEGDHKTKSHYSPYLGCLLAIIIVVGSIHSTRKVSLKTSFLSQKCVVEHRILCSVSIFARRNKNTPNRMIACSLMVSILWKAPVIFNHMVLGSATFCKPVLTIVYAVFFIPKVDPQQLLGMNNNISDWTGSNISNVRSSYS